MTLIAATEPTVCPAPNIIAEENNLSCSGFSSIDSDKERATDLSMIFSPTFFQP
jgi:hypothetical protein